MNLSDWTKIGGLIINEGTWQGRRVYNREFAQEAYQNVTIISNSDRYGYFFRLFGNAWSEVFSGPPYDETYFIAGRIGHHQYYIPSEDMVVSIYGENFGKFFNCVITPPQNTNCDPSLNFFRQVTFAFLP